MKRFNKKDYLYLFSLISIFVVVLFSIIGIKYVNGSIVDWDSQHTVIPDYFRKLFYDTKDILPSFGFNIGGGTNIYNLSYYGLLSPMVLLSYLFPFIKMVDFVQIYMVLVVISSIILMYSFLRNRFDSKLSFIGTLLFLLSGPIIYHTHRHIMFINYMPFLIMGLIGVDKYFDKNKKTLLLISVFLIIMSSYYYSVGSIITVVLYGIYKYIEVKDKITFKTFIIDGCKFLIPILIGILMSMVLILPTVYTLMNRPDITSSIDITNLLIPKFNIGEILYNSYTIGTTSVLLIAILYGYVSKTNNKLLSIVFTLLTIFPIVIYIFSGFMYVRGKVLIPFLPLAILLIVNFFKEHRSNKIFNILVIVLSIIEVYVHLTKREYIFILDVILLLIGYLIYIKKDNKNYFIYPVCFAALICALVSNYTERLVSKEDLRLMYDNVNYEKLDKILNDDKNIYRVSNNLLGMKNYNRVITTNYYLPSIYSSLENPYYYDLVNNNMSNEMEVNIATGISSTKNILFNTLMASKYMISKDVPIGYENIEGDIYINENVLPVGFSTPKILDYETYKSLKYPEKAFALTTNIIIDTENKEYINRVKEEDIGFEASYEDIVVEKVDDKYVINSENDGNMTIRLDNPLKNKLLFITFDMEYSERCKIGDTSITINGIKNTLSCRTWTYYNRNNKFEYVISKDELKELNVEFSKGKYEISNIKTYTLDYDLIKNFTNNVDKFIIDKDETKGDVIIGDINVNENGYFMITIPYEENGFTIYLDGKEIPYERVNDAFIGFHINEGHHDIKIVYTSPYLSRGLVMSLVGCMLFLPIIYSDIFKKKTK